jgi:hypothetical protein
MTQSNTIVFGLLLYISVAGCRDSRSALPSETTPVLVEPGISFYLDDAEVRAREHPDSFSIPSAAERSSIEPSQIVKLIFVIETPDAVQAERMWVITKRVDKARTLASSTTSPPQPMRSLQGWKSKLNLGT